MKHQLAELAQHQRQHLVQVEMLGCGLRHVGCGEAGNFKHILERSPQADMNRTVLLIPALCGRPDAATLSNALVRARQNDLATWEQEHIPYTMT